MASGPSSDGRGSAGHRAGEAFEGEQLGGAGGADRDVGRIDGEHGDRVDGHEALRLVRHRVEGVHRDVAVGVDRQAGRRGRTATGVDDPDERHHPGGHLFDGGHHAVSQVAGEAVAHDPLQVGKVVGVADGDRHVGHEVDAGGVGDDRDRVEGDGVGGVVRWRRRRSEAGDEVSARSGACMIGSTLPAGERFRGFWGAKSSAALDSACGNHFPGVRGGRIGAW